MKWLLMIAASLATAGCATEPFARPPLPVLKNVTPQVARQAFDARLPPETHAMHASSIRFPFGDLTVLERVDAEPAKDAFGVQGYMPMGMLAFDVSVEKGSLTVNSAAADFGKYEFIVEAIGRDLRQVYMDLTPSPSATATVWPKELLFTEKTPQGTLSYEYAYDPPVLIEKRLGNFWGTIWRVRYFDYEPGPDGKLRPRGMVVDDKRYFFRIVLNGRDRSQKTESEPREVE